MYMLDYVPEIHCTIQLEPENFIRLPEDIYILVDQLNE